MRERVIVPEAKHPVAQRLEKGGSTGVVIRVRRVLTTIKLHDQLPFPAAEVDDVGTDRHLARELGTEEAAIAETSPDATLCIGLPSTQLTREVSR
jgi:hypothetical protein